MSGGHSAADRTKSGSVRRLHAMLMVEANSTRIENKRLADACSRQANLARYCDDRARIWTMSLNTLKKVADDVIEDGGWKKLDSLRRIVNKKRAKKRGSGERKSIHKDAPISLGHQLEAAERTRANLIRAYFDALEILEQASTKDERTKESLLRHKATYFSLLFVHVIQGERQ